MSKNTHAAREITNGMVYTFCGISFPEKGSGKPWIFWGVCPRCNRAMKRDAKQGRR
ncbi:hypothetical protein [Amycolatopsis pithecellobii]|uniref:Uncharacterized protein n=1 Tax=Amycolatopsis pithecellobii TaxID=664692 RepID=A0A6N7Z5D9_9PSEU|nr:hypothetical protein [Amycolatopsis pithecellobii]MTD55720.1 hypothetical protein [Amycolatopsis pithecellobii]